jgi:hypothetical protein
MPSTSVATTANPLDIAEAIRFREAYGLRADTAFVADVAESIDVVRDWGVPLTPPEANELQRRVAIEQRLGDLQDFLRWRPEFAGVYIDQAAGHVIDVAVTAETEQLREQVKSLMPEGARYRIREVRTSLGELEQLQDRVDADGIWMREALGIVPLETYVDVKENVVAIGVSTLTDVISSAISARYGDSTPTAFLTTPGLPTHCVSRDHCDVPLRGGTRLFDWGCSNSLFL